jgi:superfamily II DNA or RNA helicase
MNAEFKAAGITSECITSKTKPEDRKRILAAFSDGLFPVLNNCGILTTGYDEPSIECVIMNRKTKSLPLWLQCCGRGSRIFPGKSEFIVLDFGQNHNEHGLWSEPREWKLEQPKKRKKLQAAPVKDCPECYAMIAASARKCSFCGYTFSETQKDLEEGVMVEVKPKAPEKLKGKFIATCTVDELIELQKSKRYKAAFIWRVVRAQGRDKLTEYSNKMKYSKGWLFRQINDIEGTTFKNILIS